MSAVFEVSHLKKAFGGLTVTNDVSLSMAPGDRVALIGPNGAGKTTFVNLVTGNLRPDSGVVKLNGEDVTKVDAIGRVRRGLVRSFQVTRTFPGHDVGGACRAGDPAAFRAVWADVRQFPENARRHGRSQPPPGDARPWRAHAP